MAAENTKPSITGRIAAVIPLILLVTLIYFLPQVAAGRVLRVQLNWIPSLGVTLPRLIDGLSLLYGRIICCVGFFVSVYAADYLPGSADRGRFFVYLQGFLPASGLLRMSPSVRP
jgi:NADH:ubiquinone oxidoreductase subunit 5 (subunit L)/multisubunit Na+/H+ antiporter MnhA subunit